MQKRAGAPTPTGAPVLRKRCTQCRKIKLRTEFKPRSDRPGHIRSRCRKCTSQDNQQYRKPGSDKWYRRRNDATLVLMDIAKAGPLYPHLSRLVRKPERRALNNWEWLAAHSHQMKCPVTGMAFDLSNTKVNGATHPLHPSIDRLDCTKGYTPENSRVISYWANIAKSTMTESMFRMMVTNAASNMRH